MAANLTHRDFLKELDFTAAELQYLLDLARRPQAGQVRPHRDPRPGRTEHRADLREDLDPHPVRVRGRCLRPGRARHLPRPRLLPDRAQGVGRGHRTGAVADVRRDRVPRQGAGHDRGAGRRLRRAGLQRAHRRVAPDPDARRLPDDDRALAASRCTTSSYCFMGDGRFNMGRSLLVMGAIMGADVRICAPKDLWPDKDVQDAAARAGRRSGARITLTDDPAEGLAASDFVHTDVWVSMGEPKDVWVERVAELTPYQVNARRAGRAPATRTSGSCTACRRSTTRSTVGRRADRRARPA